MGYAPATCRAICVRDPRVCAPMSEADKPAREIRALTGARALPPLFLVLYHYHEGHGYQHVPWFDIFVAKGYLWVEFFFVLSGFILTYVYFSRWQSLFTLKGYGQFLRNRLARLYPVHLAMIIVLGGMLLVLRALAHAGGYVSVFDLPIYHPDMSLRALAFNLLLIQAWHVMGQLSWNGVAWFISVEFALCLAFPIFLFAARGTVGRALLLLALGFITLRNLALTSGHGLDLTFDLGLVRGFADFAIGVALAMLHRHWSPKLARVPEVAFTVAQLLVFATFFYVIYHTGWAHNPMDVWIAGAMTLIVASLAFDRGAVARLFMRKPLQRLGEWSYAIYMGQTALLMLLRFLQQRIYPEALVTHYRLVHVLEPTLLVPACVLWGYVLYRLVEKPANRWLRGPAAPVLPPRPEQAT